MNELLKVVGKRVRKFRKLKGLTQEELSEKAEIHYSYIGGIERGERNISMETFEKICSALNIPPYVFFQNQSLGFPPHDLDKQMILKLHKNLLESRNTEEILLIHETVQRIVNLIDKNLPGKEEKY